MAVKVFFSLACTTFAFWYCISSSSGDANDTTISENTWNMLDPAVQNLIINLKRDKKKFWNDKMKYWKNNRILKKNYKNLKKRVVTVEYERFICAANIIRRCGDTLYKEVTEYLKNKYIHEKSLEHVPKNAGFEERFNLWRLKTYKPKNGKMHRSIIRICPANQIKKGRATQEEFFDFIENSASKRAQNLRKLLPTYERRRYLAALMPCSFYKMCTCLHRGGSLALKKFENGTEKSLTEALLTHNHWRMNVRDIRYFNIVLSLIKENFELGYEPITDDGIVFPVASLKTGCDIK